MRLECVFPLGPVVDGIALNITVQSYEESLFVGVNASARAVPHLTALTAAMEAELVRLNRMALGAPARHDSAHRRPRGPAGAAPTRRPVSPARTGGGGESSEVARTA